MTVAVQKHLHQIKQGLMEYGYDVVTYGEYKYPVDAIVYSGGEVFSFTNQMNIPSNGMLMVNCTNKTIAEIDNILKRRVYTPLF